MMISFTVTIGPDGCKATTDHGAALAWVSINGVMTQARRDRIAKLMSELIAECQDADVCIAPFGGVEKPS